MAAPDPHPEAKVWDPLVRAAHWALALSVALAGFSRWLYTTDAYWGDPWMESVHYAFSVSLPVLVALHVTGVIVTSYRHRENLVAAMLHGRKRPPAGDDVY